MIKPQDFLEILHDLLELDPEATHNLIESRVKCIEKVEGHPSLIPYRCHDDAPLQLGPLGLINGVLGKYGYRIVAYYHDDPNIKLFDFRLLDLRAINPTENPTDMEKKAVIEEDITPPEVLEEKQASKMDLEDHVTKRLADVACKAKNGCKCDDKRSK